MRKGRDREHMGNTLKTTLLLAVLTVLFVLVGKAIGGESGMVFAFGLAVVMNVGSYWFSDKIVLRMYSAREVTESESPQLHGMVRRLALAAGVPMPKVYIIPGESPNAFATGRDPAHAAVAATEGILRLLSPEELEGVLAHEMAHVRNRDILIGTVAATLAGAIMMLANFARFAAIFGGGRDDREGGGGLQLLVMAILAPLGAMMVQMAVSRSREYRGAFLREARCAGAGPRKDLGPVAAGADGGVPGHGPHVHHQSADRRRFPEPVQHAPACYEADRAPDGDAGADRKS